MALKLIGSRNNEQNSSTADSSSEGWPSYIGRNLARTGVDVLTGVGETVKGLKNLGHNVNVKLASALGLPEEIQEHIRKPVSGPIEKLSQLIPTKEHVSSGLKKLGVSGSDEYLEPQSPLEEAVSYTSRALPIIALTGGVGSIGRKIAADFAGSLAGVGAKEAGVGPIGQIISSTLASGAFNRYAPIFKKGGTPKRLVESAENAKKEFYDTEKKLGSNIYGKAKSYKKGINGLYDEISGDVGLDNTQRQNLLEKLSLMEDDISKGKISGSQLIDSKKKINSLFNKSLARRDKDYRTYLRRINGLIKGEAEVIGKDHPEWLNAWKSGDQIETALNFKSKINNLISEIPYGDTLLKSGLARSALTTGSSILFGTPVTTSLIRGATLAAGGSVFKKAQQLYGFWNQPASKKILKDIVLDISNDSSKKLGVSLTKFNKLAEDYEKKNPIENKESKGGLRLIGSKNQ